MTKMINKLGDRLLSAVLPKAKAAACVGDQYGWCVYRYTGCGGSQCYQYYQCGAYCRVYQGGVGGTLVNSWRGCC